MPMRQFTEQEAIAFAESECWEGLSLRQRASLQMYQRLLCMPFGVFHEAIEKTLGRPVFTHEFGTNLDGLKAELGGKVPPPTIEEIISLIPIEKRVVVFMP